MFAENKTNWNTIIIGGGQAGLAVGYYLQSLHVDFLILEGSDQIGDSWRNRWDSLHLFTPNWANALPAYSFPGAGSQHASKDEVANYLNLYAEKFKLPLLTQARVTHLDQTEEGYRISSGRGLFHCRNVVIANGGYARPKIPAFSKEIAPTIRQLHSSGYQRPSDLPDGDVLVVGAATSGIQIAIDVASAQRKTYLAGTPPGRVPDLLLNHLGKQVIWAMNNIITIKTRMGRKAEHAIKVKGQASPLIHISMKDAEKAGVIPISRIAGVEDGSPVSESGTIMPVSTVIWCTGYSCDLSWIGIDDLTDEKGYPIAKRGIAGSHKGLYFVGMPFQYALTSSWLKGVGRDAEYVARHIHQQAKVL